MAQRPRLRLVRPLTVDLDALEEAFDGQDLDGTWYIDLHTGDVRFVDEGDLPHDVFQAARGRWQPVPLGDPSDTRADMEAFAEGVEDPRLRRRLRDALKASDGGMRYRVAVWEAEAADEWSMFAASRRRERVVEWLASLGFGAVDVSG